MDKINIYPAFYLFEYPVSLIHMSHYRFILHHTILFACLMIQHVKKHYFSNQITFTAKILKPSSQLLMQSIFRWCFYKL